jgi:hypothetical protein
MPILSGFLEALHARPRWAWLGFIAYAAAVTFPHENVQWFVNEIAIRISLHRLYQVSAAIAAVEALLFTGIVANGLRKQESRSIPAVFWIVTLALIGFTWRVFTANNVELVHYPQYVPEGMALLALTLSPAESLAWVTIFGGLDECYQYAVLSRFRAVPYDFNDVYMDLLGGALGVLLAMALLRCKPRRQHAPPLWKRPGIAALLGIVTTGILLWVSGLMLLFEDKADTRHWFVLSRFRAPAFWFQVVANGPNKYHTLSPIEGPILILGTIAVYALLDRWVIVGQTTV